MMWELQAWKEKSGRKKKGWQNDRVEGRLEKYWDVNSSRNSTQVEMQRI